MRAAGVRLRCAIAFAAALVGHGTAAFAGGACEPAPVTASERAACRAELERQWRDETAKEAAVVSRLRLAAAADALAGRPVAALPAADDKERASKERKRIARAYAEVATTREEAMREAHCERTLTICYDRNGKLVAGSAPPEGLPAAVRVGDKLTVVVLTTELDSDKSTVAVTFQGRQSLDTLLPKPVEPLRDRTMSLTEDVLPDSYAVITFPAPDPVPEDAVDFAISFLRAPVGSAPGADSEVEIPVERGYSYYSVAFLVAATFKADRHVLRDLGTTSDHAVDPGLALNVFPFGRQQGVIGYLRKCTWRRFGRCLANTVGFQIGTDLDLTNPTDKLYVGAVFEPVAGLAIVGGVSLRKVAVVPPAGALPALEAMDGSSPTDSRYVARGYVGVTITLDLLDTISSTGTKIKGVKVP